MASHCVLVNDLLIGDGIDNALRVFEKHLCSSFIAGIDRFANFLDRGTQRRAQTHVVSALLDGLTGALAGLCGVGHLLFRNSGREKRAIIWSSFRTCNTPFSPNMSP